MVLIELIEFAMQNGTIIVFYVNINRNSFNKLTNEERYKSLIYPNEYTYHVNMQGEASSPLHMMYYIPGTINIYI